MATLPYVSTLHGYFLGDDFGLVQLFAGKPPWHFLNLFSKSYAQGIWGYTTDELRPFAALSYQLGALGGKNSPVLQHMINIALHVLTALLVLVTARSIGRASWIASAFAAALFAVLPIHAETVAWITGRADSAATLFYALAFLGYAYWRSTHSRWYLVISLATYVLALYSKQSTVTLPATLLFYDWLTTGRKPTLSWIGLRPYFPYLALTAAMLVLRYLLFGELVRESALEGSTIAIQYIGIHARYLQLLLLGSVVVDKQSPLLVLVSLGAIGFCILLLAGVRGYRLVRTTTPDPIVPRHGMAIFFGPTWWLICTAPLLVAGYTTARFLYLAAFDALQRSRHDLLRHAAAFGAVILVAAALQGLLTAVKEWNAAALISEKIMQDVQREAAGAPQGTLLIIGAPSMAGTGHYPTILWDSAIPFALQPPFMESDLTKRHFIVCPEGAYHATAAWFSDMRLTLSRWSASSKPAPIVAMRWDRRTGRIARRTDGESPDLRAMVQEMANARSRTEMAERLNLILGGS